VSSLKPTCIDLFCGCGGFTLGIQRAGFRVLAAIDSNPEAVATLRGNLVDQHHPALIPVSHTLQRDLSRFEPAELAALLGVSRVDVIVGGPPCQGFSTARQVDGANHGARLKRDRGVVLKGHYDRSSFKDRYTRQSRWGRSDAIGAHLSKDGPMFVHPTQSRNWVP